MLGDAKRRELLKDEAMLTLFSYPPLFGVANNNPYGLKIFAFLKLCKCEFRHVHIIDAKAAPRGQLPYIDDDGEILGDSDRIIAHVSLRNGLTIDTGLSHEQLAWIFCCGACSMIFIG